jgi:hypothetical protein
MTTQTLIAISPDELERMIAEAVRQNTPEPVQKKDEELLSPKSTADIFDISLVTLRSWRLRGVIKSIKIGGRRYYRKAEVENLIHQKYR